VCRLLPAAHGRGLVAKAQAAADLVDPHQFALSAMRLPLEVVPGLSTGVLLRGLGQGRAAFSCFGSVLASISATVLDAALRLPLPKYGSERARLGR
jgi:hypothetical protein